MLEHTLRGLCHTVMGLDVSASVVGCVVLRPGPDVVFARELPGIGDGYDRLEEHYRTVRRVVGSFGPYMVVIEGYGFGNRVSLVPLVEVGTLVRWALREIKVPWVDVAPTQLKKFVTGSGVAPKERMMLSIYKKWGYESDTHNVADAFGLALIGLALRYQLDPLTAAQQAVCDALRGRMLRGRGTTRSNLGANRRDAGEGIG